MSARSWRCAKDLTITGLSALGLFLAVPATKLLAQVNVPTWRYDNAHQGQNTQETILTPTNVNTNTFGKLFSQPVDGQVYAQPLYVSNLTINGATHNVLFVATEHDSVYAFDADNNGGANSAPLWQAVLSSTAHGAGAGAITVPSSDVQSGTGDIHPEIGITGTPVIDLATQTLFVLAKTKENGTYFQRLHALNMLTGAERGGSPVAISASVPGNGNGSSNGTLAFSILWQNNRVAMGLFNGNLYLGFGSHGDDGPWHGWVLVYNETTLAQTAAICTSPNGSGDGVWSSGAAFPIDTVTANGRAFIVTGNGDYSTYPPLNNSVDYGESIMRYDLSNGGFAISDAFTPFNQNGLTGADLDQGSGGILMLPDQPGTYPHLLVQVGKEGRILVLNRDKLNGYAGAGAGSNTNAVQDIVGPLKSDSGLWSTPAYWNGNVYMWASSDTLKLFPLTNGVLATTYSSQSSVTSSFPGASPVVSSNGTQNGIVWAVRTDEYNSNGPAVLYAFNPTNLGQEYYASNQNSTRDNAGQAVKFVVPVVTNGKVYVGTGGQVTVYGLLNQTQQAPAPVISPSGGTYGGPQQITMTDSVAGATIYYTIDGSTPTINSTKYVTGGFSLAANATVQAFASAGGYLQSTITSATYTFNTQTPTPTFSPTPGSYTSAQSVTITDNNTAIYYTTDGSTPTINSTLYSGPITVNGNTVINAIAVYSGLSNSAVATGSYLIQLPGTGINYANGFASVAGLTLNGSATNVDDSRLQLTTGVSYQAGSVFYNTPTNIQTFTTDFAFQLSNAVADGFTFTIQNVGPTALGGVGGALGYGPYAAGNVTGIANSVAIKFDFFNNSGEGTDSTGIYTNGLNPTVPAFDMTSSGVVLSSGDTIDGHMTYDGTNLVLTLTDIVVNKVFTHTFPINIPGTIGSNTAYIGFTGGSGGGTASQKILSWTLTSAAPTATPTSTPSFTPVAGTYGSAQSVTINDTTPGAVIYYTTNGSAPTTASAVYGKAIAVAASMTLQAIAVAAGYSQSAVATAAYVIQSAAATPGFTPAGGSYASAQSVTVNDTTPGAVIYYTTNGSAPTTASAVYGTTAIPVAANETLQAIAVAAGYSQSAVATAAYVIQSAAVTPSFTPAGGSYASAQSVTINDTTPGAVIYYTTNGSAPTTASAVYGTTAIPVAANETLQAIAVAAGYSQSAVATAAYVIQSAAATPGFTPAGGSYASAQSVTVNDTTPGAVIYYTTNGSAPTTASAVYGTTAIPVAANETLQAIAVAAGYSQSAVATAAYVIQSTTAAPTFSPVAGTYGSAQSVTITDAGATIYYTTDGSMPTTASAQYSTAIPVTSNTTVQAIAVIPGSAASAVASAVYVIQSSAPSTLNFAGGFPSAAGLQLNGNPKVNANYLEITDGGTYEANSVFWTTPVNVQTFTTNFTFQINSAIGDGLTFTIQNAGLTAVGSLGGGLGYGIDPSKGTGASIGKSVAVKFDTFNNAGEGTNSTGVYSNGAGPALPSVDLTSSGIKLVSGDTISAQLVYDGTTLTLNLTDTVTGNTFTHAFTINIPATVGANTAYIGFTGGTGSSANIQNIKTWTFSSTTTPTAAEPGFNPTPGTYAAAQNVTLTAAQGATIYYTVDGSTPNHNSATYSAPIVVNGVSLTIRAFASATGYLDSPIVLGTYQIQPTTVATPPTFTPVAGNYTSAQSVTLTAAQGATIYYTTDGSTPTTGSAKYSTAILVSNNTTVQAIAVVPGSAQSAVASATYTIQSSAPSTLSFAGGFPSAAGLQLNGAAKVNANYLEITDGGANEANSAFWTTPVNVQTFTTNFTFQINSAIGNGLTFTVQNAGLTAVGALGGGLGYGIDPSKGTGSSIGKSVAVKFDILNNAGEGNDSTGLYTNGAGPALPAVDLTSSGIKLASGDTMSAQLVYDGTNLTLTLIDTVTGTTFTHAFPINIPATVGGNTAYVGFTGGTGSSANVQNIKTWTFSSTTTPTAAVPAFTPTPGTYATAQNVTLTAAQGATIYYTVDGSTPNHNSATYSTPIATGGASLTIRAFASATGYQDSPIVVGTYQIQAATVATPVISPTTGTTFLGTLNVSMTDTTANSTIYYTSDGSTPTTGSTLYGGAFNITASTSFKAIAVATGYTQSAVASAAYVLQSATAPPSFTPGGGTFATAQSVTLADATPGAVIYYTTNGSAPTTASAVYSNTAIPVAANETLNAIAVATGYTQSAVATAAYVIQSATATPIFTPGGGSFAAAQSVTLADATPGAVIYYTTNGTAPTTASAVYNNTAIPVAASETLNAIAVATGYTQSAVATAAYVIQPASIAGINFAGGFPSATGFQLNSVAKVNAGSLELTDGGGYEAGSVFWTTPVNIQSFTTNFTFQLVNAVADGFTFTMQNTGPTAIGSFGGGLGFGLDPSGGTTAKIGQSVAVKFDFYNNSGEGNYSVGVFTNGVAPTTPAVNLASSGIVLTSGDTMTAQLVYNGTTLTLTLTDTVTKKTFTQAFTINIPATVGANTAYVGFTGGTGGGSAIQNIQAWTMTTP